MLILGPLEHVVSFPNIGGPLQSVSDKDEVESRPRDVNKAPAGFMKTLMNDPVCK